MTMLLYDHLQPALNVNYT